MSTDNRPELVILPTIDVEGTHGTDPFRQMVLGDIDHDQQWGVHRIADALARHELTGTFFVDVYEHTLWGKERWREVCQRLVQARQDVQLHTHPGWRSDDPRDQRYPQLVQLKREHCYVSDKRYLMTHLTQDEQLEMIVHGGDLLEQWIGQRPMAHRSGEYAANTDTLEALLRAGIAVDCSQHAGHPQCRLTLTHNALAKYRDLLEIPVTVYDRVLVPAIKHPRLRKRTKSDLAFGFYQLVNFCQRARQVGMPVVTLFMHSYSLIRLGAFDRVLGPDTRALRDLDRFLAWARSTSGVQVMSVHDYYDSGLWQAALAGPNADTVPTVLDMLAVPKALARRVQRACSFPSRTPVARAD